MLIWECFLALAVGYPAYDDDDDDVEEYGNAVMLVCDS